MANTKFSYKPKRSTNQQNKKSVKKSSKRTVTKKSKIEVKVGLRRVVWKQVKMKLA